VEELLPQPNDVSDSDREAPAYLPEEAEDYRLRPAANTNTEFDSESVATFAADGPLMWAGSIGSPNSNFKGKSTNRVIWHFVLAICENSRNSRIEIWSFFGIWSLVFGVSLELGS
jgi:hypothetical protein